MSSDDQCATKPDRVRSSSSRLHGISNRAFTADESPVSNGYLNLSAMEKQNDLDRSIETNQSISSLQPSTGDDLQTVKVHRCCPNDLKTLPPADIIPVKCALSSTVSNCSHLVSVRFHFALKLLFIFLIKLTIERWTTKKQALRPYPIPVRRLKFLRHKCAVFQMPTLSGFPLPAVLSSAHARSARVFRHADSDPLLTVARHAWWRSHRTRLRLLRFAVRSLSNANQSIWSLAKWSVCSSFADWSACRCFHTSSISVHNCNSWLPINRWWHQTSSQQSSASSTLFSHAASVRFCRTNTYAHAHTNTLLLLD